MFLSSLPVADQDGTLSLRFRLSQLAQNAFMKTGTRDNVRALSGYWKTPSQHWYSFVALLNCTPLCTESDQPWLDKKVEKIYRTWAH